MRTSGLLNIMSFHLIIQRIFISFYIIVNFDHILRGLNDFFRDFSNNMFM